MSYDECDKPWARVMYGDAAWHDGPGWYYVDDEYHDEGSCGAFATRDKAVEHAKEAGYRVAPTKALDARPVCAWCAPHFSAKLEGRSSDHTRCDDLDCGCHCQDRLKVN